MNRLLHFALIQPRVGSPLLLSVFLFCSCIVGCSLTAPAPSDDVRESTVEHEHAPAVEIWRALAHSIDAGTIDSTTDLARFVTVLARNGDLSSTDVASFETVFPTALHEQRALTSKDSDLLRTMK